MILKPVTTTSNIAILNITPTMKTTKNAENNFTKQAINSQSATPTIQTAPTVYLYATTTYKTPRMKTPSATQNSLHLRNKTPNAIMTTLLPKTVYRPATLPFHSLKIITTIASQI